MNERDHLNLLPMRFRKKVVLRERLQSWSFYIFLAVLVAAGICGERMRRLTQLREQVTVRAFKVDPVRSREGRITHMQTELQQLHAPDGLLHEALRASQPLKLVSLVSRSAQAANNGLQIKTLRFRPADPSHDQAVILHGAARDNRAIAELVAALRKPAIFEDVESGDIRQTNEENRSLRRFTITCRLAEERQ